MTSITFNVPDNVDISKLTKALHSVGIVPDIDSFDEDDLIPLDIAIASAFPDMTPQEIIGNMLRVTREDANLTQKALAELVGEKDTNISAMERGKRVISKKMAQKLGEVLNVSYHTFL